jgi:DNA-binding NtrC family response regulator
MYHDNESDSISDDASLEEIRKDAVDRAEIAFLEKKLSQTKGNVTKIAQGLDMNRSYLQKLLKKHGIKSKEFKVKKQG